MKQSFILTNEAVRRRAMAAVAEAPPGHVITIAEPTRNTEQNAMLWALLDAFAKQLEWPVNGRMVRMDSEDWKHVLSAAFRQETARLAMGLDGGVVMLGLRTSRMGKREFSEFIEFLLATAADRGVVIDRPAAVEYA